MAVYADILFLVNTLVDYFLLRLSAIILHKNPSLWRQLLASITGGIFSFYIFLPQQTAILEFAVKIFICAFLCFIAFGFGEFKSFIRAFAVLFAVNFAYTGGMIAVWYLFKPFGMIINNSVIYFNISPLFLIVFSVLSYFCILLFRKFFSKSFPQSAICEVELISGGKKICAHGIVDTGNSLKDGFGVSEIIIVDTPVAEKITNNLASPQEKNSHYRAIPCNTVSGVDILDGYRIDAAVITYNKKIYKFKNPVIAVSKSRLVDCDAIINPESL